VTTDETEKNKVTVRHGDIYEGRVRVMKGSGFENSSGTDVVQGSHKFIQNFPKFHGTRRFIFVFKEPPTIPYPDPNQSSPYHLILSLYDPF
jgi:hypothetical protein